MLFECSPCDCRVMVEDVATLAALGERVRECPWWKSTCAAPGCRSSRIKVSPEAGQATLARYIVDNETLERVGCSNRGRRIG